MREPANPLPQLTPEDRVFLNEFGQRISTAMGSAAVAGGVCCYAVSRQLGWKRRGAWTALGATLCPVAAWYVVMSKERERVMALGQKLQAADGADAAADPSRPSGDEAMARLFPPPPTAGLAAGSVGMPPRGLPGMALPGQGFPGVRPGQ
eukprot:TRINITY_DN28219_c0_g1_i1.p1 TRINITY_DN28219_c0_g1~~TRINITY_DN28219_c0_g1_i1.p1  ORF type:complete len:150 (-),score=31.16 TRINITY_DN28219_c0_g1_i1:70-519(-)